MYVPLSNIKFSGYTNGQEFLFKSNFQPYIGPYFIDVNDKIYTGAAYTTNSVELIKSTPNVSNVDINKQTTDKVYSTLLSPPQIPNTVITPDYIIPSDKDYSKGYFVRFILKPTISSLSNDFIEVKFNKYNQVLQDTDLQSLYQFANVVWKLTGPVYDEYNGNIRVRSGILDTNKRAISEAEKYLPNLSLYFTDLLQFSY